MSATSLRGLAVALAVVGVVLGRPEGGTSTPHDAPREHYVSRPDLHPPKVTILRRARDTAPGYLFVSPERAVEQAGPLILRNDGQVVWFLPVAAHRVTNFRVQRYHGRPVLTWWSAEAAKGSGHKGVYVIADEPYRIIARFSAADGLAADLHEFLLTPRGTAIVTVYRKVSTDLSSIGGSEHGAVWEGIVQEIDVATRRLLFEWHSLDHLGVDESYESLPTDPSKTYDYFHINAVDLLPNGNLLVSGRNTHAVYEIRRSDGAVLWQLGGKGSDFALGRGARFAWQHDARLHPNGTVTLFDNGVVASHRGRHSRVIVLRLDGKRHRAILVHSYRRTRPVASTSEGNGQVLPDGHVLVGWGSQPYVSEFTPGGRMLLDLRLGPFGVRSYRSFRFPWTGRPITKPAIAAVRRRDGTLVYASWNGATAVARWRVLAGPDANHLETVATSPKTGFETRIGLDLRAHVVRVAALDSRGRVLRFSERAVAK
jgi:Arylsulfotransferase (ASST)